MNFTGQLIGQYEVLELLGVGGMAEVYKAYQPRLERYVAIKFIRPEFAKDQGFKARFEREAKAIARLSHGAIVHVYDFGEQDGRYYLVMEFIAGGTLKKHLANLQAAGKGITLSDALSIMQQIGGALDYAHQQGIIHRDVKPDNIMLTTTGRAFLNDFGIAKIFVGGQDLTKTGMIIGTPSYISPEQVKGEKSQLGPASDLYSLAVILYQLLTGQVPFSAETPLGLIYKHVHEPVPSIRSLNPVFPEALEAIILKALAKAPAERYQSVGEFIEALQKITTEGSDSLHSQVAPPSSPPSEKSTRKWQKKRPLWQKKRPFWQKIPLWLWGILGALLLLAIVAGSLMLANTPRHEPIIVESTQEPVATEEPAATEELAATEEPAATEEETRTKESAATEPAATEESVIPDSVGHITYTGDNQRVYRVEAREGATPEDISAALDKLSEGSGDVNLNSSPNGAWLVLQTERFYPECVEWSCLALVKGDLSAGEAVRTTEGLLHAEGRSAVTSDGNLIIYSIEGDGAHIRELWAVKREGKSWNGPLLLTRHSPYAWNHRPTISSDGKQVVFTCGDEPYGGAGSAICEVNTEANGTLPSEGTNLQVLLRPTDRPDAPDEGSLQYPHYAPDGTVIFSASWEFQESSVCTLPDGRLISTSWDENDTPLKVYAVDGESSFVIQAGVLINDPSSIGCGE